MTAPTTRDNPELSSGLGDWSQRCSTLDAKVSWTLSSTYGRSAAIRASVKVPDSAAKLPDGKVTRLASDAATIPISSSACLAPGCE